MKYIPRHNFVILQMDVPPDRTRGGILLSEKSRDERQPATILAVGPGVRAGDKNEIVEIDDLKEGDRVIFNKYSALELDEDRRIYLVRDVEIGCKLDD